MEIEEIAVMTSHCSNCNKIHNFDTEVSGYCSTCKKKDMCEKCCYSHTCIPGKVRQLHIIINPKWISNLRKSLNYEDKKIKS